MGDRDVHRPMDCEGRGFRSRVGGIPFWSGAGEPEERAPAERLADDLLDGQIVHEFAVFEQGEEFEVAIVVAYECDGSYQWWQEVIADMVNSVHEARATS